MVGVHRRVEGGQLVVERQLVTVCGNEFRHVVAPLDRDREAGEGPVTEMQDENRSASPATSLASSQPVTIHTPWCGSRTTGHRACRPSRYG